MQTSHDLIHRLVADHQGQLRAEADESRRAAVFRRHYPTRLIAAMLRFLLARAERRLDSRPAVSRMLSAQ
ncbi:MAG: hypothetical protein ACRD29_03565 [Acidimicrobiales bacterium]